ncbi:MAG: hypothetical protein ABF868_11070 [Sporolactobacillus sp.]
MKKIFSFKLTSDLFRVKNMIRFYKSCEKLGQTVYVYGRDKMEQAHRLPQFLSVLMNTLLENGNCLIVVEGEHLSRRQFEAYLPA